ncbi:MAG: DUF6329 domain-containing protein [Candidatus Izemoplasmatales bacterium]|jgi:ethanolamine utilization protein EutP (predicted NTPase)
MKVNFIRKATTEELMPQDEFIIEKTVNLNKIQFESFIRAPFQDYDFIVENIESMYCDNKGVYHCIFVTSEDFDFGILIESEGYHHARYAAYLPKMMLKKDQEK